MDRQWYKTKLILPVIPLAIAGAILSLTPATTEANPKLRFVCLSGGKPRVPTTYAWQLRSKKALIRWEKKIGSYAPQQRCQQASPRFQQAYKNGSLKFLTNGYMNNQPVICATREYGGSCQTLLFTLAKEEDGQKIVNELKDILNGYQVGPIKQTNQVFIQVDIDEFLRNAPVETEAQP